jgi:hypothetical protein
MLSFAADLRPLLLLICSPRINRGYLLSPNSVSNACMTGISPFLETVFLRDVGTPALPMTLTGTAHALRSMTTPQI